MWKTDIFVNWNWVNTRSSSNLCHLAGGVRVSGIHWARLVGHSLNANMTEIPAHVGNRTSIPRSPRTQCCHYTDSDTMKTKQTVPQVQKCSKKSTSHRKIVGARNVTRRKFHIEDPQIVGDKVQNAIARATWPKEFMHPWLLRLFR